MLWECISAAWSLLSLHQLLHVETGAFICQCWGRSSGLMETRTSRWGDLKHSIICTQLETAKVKWQDLYMRTIVCVCVCLCSPEKRWRSSWSSTGKLIRSGSAASEMRSMLDKLTERGDTRKGKYSLDTLISVSVFRNVFLKDTSLAF